MLMMRYKQSADLVSPAHIEVQQVVQLASFLEVLNRVVISSVLVIDKDDRQLPSASLLEDSLPILAFHHVDRNPGLKVGSEMHLLGLEQTLQVDHVVSPLFAAGGGRIEYTNFAFSSQTDCLQHSYGEDASGDVESAKGDVDFVFSRLCGSVRDVVAGGSVGIIPLGDVDRCFGTGSLDLHFKFSGAVGCLHDEGRLLVSNPLNETRAISAARLGKSGGLVLSVLAIQLGVAEIRDVGHDALLVDSRIGESFGGQDLGDPQMIVGGVHALLAILDRSAGIQ